MIWLLTIIEYVEKNYAFILCLFIFITNECMRMRDTIFGFSLDLIGHCGYRKYAIQLNMQKSDFLLQHLELIVIEQQR